MSVKQFSGLRAPACAIAAAVSLLLTSGCGQQTAAQPMGAPPPPAVLATATVTRDVPQYLEVIGKCVAPEIVSIQPQVSGRITGIHFKDGVDLKKGDPLFTIDPRPFQIQLNQARAEKAMNAAALKQSEAALKQSETALPQQEAAILRAQALLEESKSRQKLAVMEFERAKGLLETNAVARQEFDSRQIAVDTGLAQIRANEAAVNQARAELEQSKAAVSQAQAAIEVAKARLATSDAMIATAELNVEYTSIVSPINARAGQRHVDIGNIVTANSTGTPLVVLQTLDPIYAEFVVPESELSRIQASLSAKTLSAEAWAPETPDAKKKGEVTFLDNNVQGQTGTIRLRATVQNAERAFWPGQFVNVRLILGTHKSANLIPNVAVQVGQKGLFIYVVKDDSTVEQRPVKVGQRHGTDVSILDGLKPGETVVTDGHLALQPGAKVQVQQQAVTPEQQAAEKKSNAASEGDGAK